MKLALNFERVDPSRGGAETYIADLCRHLVRAGHEVHLYARDWRSEAIPPEVVCRRVEATGWTRPQQIWNFARASEAVLSRDAACFDCTIGFINTWFHDVIIPQGGVHPASLEANAHRFPAGWRRTLYRWSKRANPRWWMYRALERKQYAKGRRIRVVAVSAMVRGHLERYYQVPRDRIHVIPNAIDARRLEVADPVATRAAFRQAQGLREDDLVGLFVGHNYALKGLGPLLNALHLDRLREPEGRPIRLVVCGGGKIGPFRRQAERLGLADRVRFVGFYPEVRDCFWASDFFVLPSYYDPCSLVVFEALACGLPVITTACNGAGEVITPGREGIVVAAPGEREALAVALRRMADEGVRAEMSRWARALGQAQSFENHVRRLDAVFAEVAASRSQRTLSGMHSWEKSPRLEAWSEA